MLVLIDESGDTGFKEGSSRFFVMTMIVFDDNDGDGRYPSAEETSLTIKNDYLIQLADMCCSAIAYSYNRSDRLESDTYVKIRGTRIKNIW